MKKLILLLTILQFLTNEAFSQNEDFRLIVISGIAIDLNSNNPLRRQEIHFSNKMLTKANCYSSHEEIIDLARTNRKGFFEFYTFSYGDTLNFWISCQNSAQTHITIPYDSTKKILEIELDTLPFVWYDMNFQEKCYGDSSFERKMCFDYPKNIAPMTTSEVESKLELDSNNFNLSIKKIIEGHDMTRFTHPRNKMIRVHCECQYKYLILERK